MTDPAFLFYPGDYLKDINLLVGPETHVVYNQIMCFHMRNICITHDQLNVFIRSLNDEQKTSLMMVLDQVDGGYQIKWVAESIEKRRKYSQSRRANRSKSKTSNSRKKEEPKKTYVEHMVNENENVIEDEIDVESEKRSRQNFSGLIRVYLEVEKKYIWDDDDDYHAERIRNKLRKLLKREQHADGIPTANLSDQNCFTRFRKIIEGLNPWFAANRFSLKNIDKDFNTLIQDHESKNRTNSKQSVPVSEKTEFSDFGEL